MAGTMLTIMVWYIHKLVKHHWIKRRESWIKGK